MHDIDRTQMEWEAGEYEYEFDPELEWEAGEYEYEFDPEPEWESEWEYMDTPFSEAEEMELASDLLEVYNEAELDQFLGKLFKKAWRGLKKIARSPIGRALHGIVKSVAKKALPVVGGALGSVVAPGLGTAIGSSLGSSAGRMFGLELEGLSTEDQEFEVARRFVRFAGEAAKQAAKAPPTAPPQRVAQAAVAAAARKHAPGLVGAAALRPTGRVRRSGQWVRQGRKIVVMGL